MRKSEKIIITKDGNFDLSAKMWDDQIFSEIFAEKNSVNMDQAMEISRYLRERIAEMEKGTITMPVIDKILATKAKEYGCGNFTPVRMQKSMFINNEPVIGKNAGTVLARKYLKKDG